MCHQVIFGNAQSLRGSITALARKVEILRPDGYLELGPSSHRGQMTGGSMAMAVATGGVYEDRGSL
jgi:hypothetical protein